MKLKKQHIVYSNPAKFEIDLAEFRKKMSDEFFEVFSDTISMISKMFEDQTARMDERFDHLEARMDRMEQIGKMHEVRLDNHDLQLADLKKKSA